MFIRLLIIFIDDKIIEKQIRKIVDFKLIFCKNHNLLIYSKFAIIMFEKIIGKKKIFRTRIILTIKTIFSTLKTSF